MNLKLKSSKMIVLEFFKLFLEYVLAIAMFLIPTAVVGQRFLTRRFLHVQLHRLLPRQVTLAF